MSRATKRTTGTTAEFLDWEARQRLRPHQPGQTRILADVRDDTGRLAVKTARLIEGLESALNIAEPAITLPLALIYDNIDLDPLPAP